MNPVNFRRVFRNADVKAIKKEKNPQMHQRHRRLQLNFAKKYVDWAIEIPKEKFDRTKQK